MENQLYEMYGLDSDRDVLDAQNPSTDQTAPAQKIGLKETDVNRKSISMTDPRVVLMLEQTVKKMQTKIEFLEQEVRRLNSSVARTNQSLSTTRQQLDKKIDYE